MGAFLQSIWRVEVGEDVSVLYGRFFVFQPERGGHSYLMLLLISNVQCLCNFLCASHMHVLYVLYMLYMFLSILIHSLLLTQ